MLFENSGHVVMDSGEYNIIITLGAKPPAYCEEELRRMSRGGE